MPPVPEKSRLKLSEPETGLVRIHIPKEGFSFKGSVILLVIVFWMVMILLWTIMLADFGPAWMLLSLPFWALSILALRISSKEIFAWQTIDIDKKTVTIRKRQGRQTASAELKIKEISAVSFVEGTYKTLAGLSRKGVYPALICKGEAFGIGERCRTDEKNWLLNVLKQLV